MGDLKDLYIAGAGGFGREVAWLVRRINNVRETWNLRGFIDDRISLTGADVDGYPVPGGCGYLSGIEKEVWVVCAVGSAKIRKSVIEKLSRCSNVRFATLTDPGAQISERVSLGEGTIVCAGCVLTVDIDVGRHVILNLNCTVGHDARIHDFVTAYPGVNISGCVTVGECAELGTGSQIIQGKTIADGAIVGAGAVVVKDIDSAGTYTGVPAKLKKQAKAAEKQ